MAKFMVKLSALYTFFSLAIGLAITNDLPTAVPTVVSTGLPEFIPGEGFPSLASLNLTTADLHAMDLVDFRRDPLSRRQDVPDSTFNYCDKQNPYAKDLISKEHLTLCIKYLTNLGSYPVSPKSSVRYGTIVVCGVGGMGAEVLHLDGTPTAACSDIAQALHDIYVDCSDGSSSEYTWGGWHVVAHGSNGRMQVFAGLSEFI